MLFHVYVMSHISSLVTRINMLAGGRCDEDASSFVLFHVLCGPCHACEVMSGMWSHVMYLNGFVGGGGSIMRVRECFFAAM